MSVRAMGVTIDCADPEGLADFWANAIGFTHREGDGGPYITISGSNLDRAVNHLTFQKVPEGKSAKNRVHLDIFVDDIAIEVERLVTLGATVLTPAGDPSHLGFVAVVLADPEGGEFCIVGRPEYQPASSDSTHS
ncbi:MAG: VOC family protein [Actinomycetota bacterium]|jgi:predicted enzyme related to lactoylglutathione lyase|nr:VOC family protein [Actinomycetota bacterium]MEC9473717.1 VOC family protein [Actinomycetota bacterium]MED5362426.1 VOC family protein [Actinomycetota bacterium]MEE3256394.1 VOC family protein [Actinomycetota bacterium]